MPTVKFVVEHREVDATSGKSLREIAVDAGIYPNREYLRDINCGGRGLCGTCKVWVHESTQGAASQPNLRECMHGMGKGRRLACQTRVLGDLEVITMPGGDDRRETSRPIDAPPNPTQDPSAPRKTVDEGPSNVHPFGHPSYVGRGEVPQVDAAGPK